MGLDRDEKDLSDRACRIADDLGLRLEKTNGSYALLKDVIEQALTLNTKGPEQRTSCCTGYHSH